tara:strand:+ start:611 stop:1042 length:432 start_codon:yes stop_codon:yes gene_type:complete
MKNLLALVKLKLAALRKSQKKSFVNNALQNSAATIANSCNENNAELAVSTLCCYLKVSAGFDDNIDFSEPEVTKALIADGASQQQIDSISEVFRIRDNASCKKPTELKRDETGLTFLPEGAKVLNRAITEPKFIRSRYGIDGL